MREVRRIRAARRIGGDAVLVLALLAAGCGSGGRGIGKLPGVGDYSAVLPEDNAIPGLRRKARPRAWSAGKATEYLDPEQLRWYNAYDMTAVAVAEYEYGPNAVSLTIEGVQTKRPLGAAGIYHWVRNKKLRDGGEALLGVDDIEGVVDRYRGAGNIYFYKRNVFYKILYHGPRPAPDLTEVARAAAGAVKEYVRPLRSFEWMNVPGVDMKHAAVTPGPTMQCEDLPASAWAPAPGAGAKAILYVIECDSRDKAESVAKDHRQFLRLNATNQGDTTADKGRRVVWWGVDRRGTPLIATSRANAVLIVSGADSNRIGGELLDEIVGRIAP